MKYNDKKQKAAKTAWKWLFVFAAIALVMPAVVMTSHCGIGLPNAKEIETSCEEPAMPTTVQAARPELEIIVAEQTVILEEPAADPILESRYAEIKMTDAEREELAAIIYLEAANQCFEGQQAVAEVVFNRVLHDSFPSTVYDVLHQGEDSDLPQFSTIYNLESASPTQVQYDAIDAALYGESILPLDVVFFSRDGENDRIWGQIGDHVFCYEYIWG